MIDTLSITSSLFFLLASKTFLTMCRLHNNTVLYWRLTYEYLPIHPSSIPPPAAGTKLVYYLHRTLLLLRGSCLLNENHSTRTDFYVKPCVAVGIAKKDAIVLLVLHTWLAFQKFEKSHDKKMNNEQAKS